MRVILTMSLLFLILVFLFPFRKPSAPVPQTQKKPTPTQEAPILKSVRLELGEEKLIVLWRAITKDEKVSLLPNFEDKLSGSEALAANGCNFLINGGFYTPDSKPLGLFRLGSKEFAPLSSSKLLNGFVWADDGKIRLGKVSPEDAAKSFVLQSGPYVSLESVFPKLELDRARRALVAIDRNQEVFFLAIFTENNYFSGPRLSDLKIILESLNRQTTLGLVEAVNLDGGSTLAFLQVGESSIPEIKKSGSFFCVK